MATPAVKHGSRIAIAATLAIGGLVMSPTVDSQPASASEETATASALLKQTHARSVQMRCKLINGADGNDPSANDTHHKANLAGTDLGIPISHDGSIYFFFGDSAGNQGTWHRGTSLPDAVGVANADDVANDPTTLCDQLGILTGDASKAIGPTVDSTIQNDFAPVTMTPPPGKSIQEFIHNPATNAKASHLPGDHFANMPGDFEVPSGGFSANGSIYVFYTTLNTRGVKMAGSYLAKWDAPSPNGQPNLDILYGVDERFDANGALGGNFINVSAVVDGEYVYMFGTGEFRKSTVHLARKKISALATEGGFEPFDSASGTWKKERETAAPIVDVTTIGELSVRYYPSIGRYAMLAGEYVPKKQRQILMRFAEHPEGPWSEGVVVSDMDDLALREQICCTGDRCEGEKLLKCDRAGLYGAYLLPDAKRNDDGSFTASYVVSTWEPYNVVLMTATFNDPTRAPKLLAQR